MRRTTPLLSTLLAICLALAATPKAWSAPAAGDLPSNELGRDLEGDPVALSSFAGKALVVTFWATWCPYCLKELPILQGVQKLAGKDRMQVIAVNTESRDVFRKAARALSGLDLLFTHDTASKGSEAYGVQGIPHLVIVGRDGRIVRVYRGYDESSLDDIVADINRALQVKPASLAPSPPAPAPVPPPALLSDRR